MAEVKAGGGGGQRQSLGRARSRLEYLNALEQTMGIVWQVMDASGTPGGWSKWKQQQWDDKRGWFLIMTI